MKRLASIAVGLSLTGSATFASAGYRWAQTPGCATSIAVDAANTPVIVGCGGLVDEPVYTLQQVSTGCSGGFCGGEPQWVQDGSLRAQWVDVAMGGIITALDSQGNLWSDPTSYYDGAVIGYPTGGWFVMASNMPCLRSFSYAYTYSTEYFMGANCYSEALTLIDIDNQTTPFAVSTFSSPLGVDGTAAFTAPNTYGTQQLWTFSSVWTSDGSVWGFDGTSFQEEPGWTVMAMTDHFAAASDGNIYAWSDGAPNFLSTQTLSGNWEGPVIGPVPSGAEIVQLAYRERAWGVGPTTSNLWALDADGNIWQMLPTLQ
jgi:hypothetical protein